MPTLVSFIRTPCTEGKYDSAPLPFSDSQLQEEGANTTENERRAGKTETLAARSAENNNNNSSVVNLAETETETQPAEDPETKSSIAQTELLPAKCKQNNPSESERKVLPKSGLVLINSWKWLFWFRIVSQLVNSSVNLVNPLSRLKLECLFWLHFIVYVYFYAKY